VLLHEVNRAVPLAEGSKDDGTLRATYRRRRGRCAHPQWQTCAPISFSRAMDREAQSYAAGEASREGTGAHACLRCPQGTPLSAVSPRGHPKISHPPGKCASGLARSLAGHRSGNWRAEIWAPRPVAFSRIRQESPRAEIQTPHHGRGAMRSLRDRYAPLVSFNATKRRPCLWITKRCLGTWNAKTPRLCITRWCLARNLHPMRVCERPRIVVSPVFPPWA